MKNNRSKAYRFTFDSQDFNGWERLSKLREEIKAHNKINRHLGGAPSLTFRVCAKPRLGKKNPFARHYRSRRCFYTVKMIHGQRVDVYVHRRYTQKH